MAKVDNRPEEKVMDQLRKIAALADRGFMGEAAMARQILEKKLREYGLTVDDLYKDAKKVRTFRYQNELERRLLVQILVHYFGSSSDEFKGGSIIRKKKVIKIELTDLDYAELSSEYGYYRGAFAREVKKSNEAFLVAFVNRFELFDVTPTSGQPTKELSPEELKRTLDALRIARTIEAYPYRKEIAAFKSASRQEAK